MTRRPLNPPSKPRRPTTDAAATPKHFAAPEAKLWRDLVHEYAFDDDPAALALLRTALEAHGRARQCRETIDKVGITTTDRFGQIRPNGLLQAERDARNSFLSAMRMMHLDVPTDG
jgi:hypothetical protein